MSLEIASLRSERLEIEPLAIGHAAAMLAYVVRNRDYLRPWEPARRESFYTLAERAAESERNADEIARGSGARFVCHEPGATEIVASINLSNVRRGAIHCAIVSYSVDEQRIGRGYASEILHAVTRFAFDILNLHRLDASYQPHNHASARVLEKNEFVIEGYARAYLFLDGAWRDSVLVSRTNDRWDERRA